jgi:hypothetical protein
LRQLVQSKGGNYGLPIVDVEPTTEIDLNDLKTIKKVLRDLGLSFLFHFQLGMAKDRMLTCIASSVVLTAIGFAHHWLYRK